MSTIHQSRSAALAAGFAFVLAGAVHAQPSGEFQQVRPILTSNTIIPGPGDPDGPDEARPRIPPGEVPPMDLPTYRPPRVADFGPGTPVYKDLVTGNVRILPPFAGGPFVPGQDAPGSAGLPGTQRGQDADSYGRDMSDLVLVPDPEDWPYRANCKIIMEWYDDNGMFQSSGGCSATLIDSRMILTAGHCTFNWDQGLGWCDKVFVYPGYEDGNKPYGSADASGIYGWTGWTDNADYNYDMSWVVLNRPIGGLTGWFGYGYSTDCDHYTSDEYWFNRSYPGEFQYDGEFMYTREGIFDDCTETNLIMYENSMFKGMSGSSCYKVVGNNRYCHTVSSHRNGGDSFTTRFWQSSYEWVRDVRIPGDTPNSVDFWPLWVKCSDAVAGTPLDTFTYVVHNYSEAGVDHTICADIYLSTNDNITTGDTRLGTLCFNWVDGPKGSTMLSYPDLILPPKDLVTGPYYLGVILTNADANAGNNDTDGQDAGAFTYIGRPDLVVAGIAAPNGTLNHGESFTVDYGVRNEGGMSSDGYTVDIRASTNTTITAGDPLLKSISHGLIVPGDTENWSASVVIPADLPLGDYYVGAIVTSNTAESYTNNNTGYDPNTITVTDLPDLVVVAFDVADGSYQVESDVSMDYTIGNFGSEALREEIVLDFYASADRSFGRGDYLLKTLAFRGGLDEGEVHQGSTTGLLPRGMPEGLYYVGLVLSGAPDADEGNNTGHDPVRITVGEGCAADFNGDGTLNLFDFLAFQTAYSNGERSADIDGNGLLNIFDFLAFQTLYSEGC